MVTLLGRSRKSRPEAVGMILFGSQSRRFSVGFRQRQETFTDHLNSGCARSTPLAGQRSRVTILPTWTDNRGNGSVLSKLMTTRYPSSALVMELAAETKKNRVKAQVEWTPKEFNREADALPIGDTSQFSPELELRVEPHTLKWHVLDRDLEIGVIAERAHDRLRRSGGLPDRARKQKRRKLEERLKFKDPW